MAVHRLYFEGERVLRLLPCCWSSGKVSLGNSSSPDVMGRSDLFFVSFQPGVQVVLQGYDPEVQFMSRNLMAEVFCRCSDGVLKLKTVSQVIFIFFFLLFCANEVVRTVLFISCSSVPVEQWSQECGHIPTHLVPVSEADNNVPLKLSASYECDILWLTHTYIHTHWPRKARGA